MKQQKVKKGMRKRGNKDGKQNFATGNFKGYQILTVIDIVIQKTPQKRIGISYQYRSVQMYQN